MPSRAELEVGAPYFRNYSALPWEWRLSLARVDGENLIVQRQKVGADWIPRAAVKLWWRNGRVARIRDYVHVEYLLKHSRTEAEPQGATVDHAAARGREV